MLEAGRHGVVQCCHNCIALISADGSDIGSKINFMLNLGVIVNIQCIACCTDRIEYMKVGQGQVGLSRCRVVKIIYGIVCNILHLSGVLGVLATLHGS